MPSRSSHTNNNNVILTLNNLLDIKFHQFCVAAWMLKALMAKMLISELIKGKEQYLGCHGWLLSCRGSVVCFEALIMAAQTYNYELSEVRKLLEMNRQRETRLLEGTYRSLFLTHSDDGRWKWMRLIPKTRYSSFIKYYISCRMHAREEEKHTKRHNLSSEYWLKLLLFFSFILMKFAVVLHK